MQEEIEEVTIEKEKNNPFAGPIKGFLDDVFKKHGTNKSLSPSEIYEDILAQVERPMFEYLMGKARYNQCRVTRWLGLSRGTTRKKMKKYDLID